MENYLELPFEIQVSLAAGFLGYCVAYSGKRSHHKPFESAMIILIFSVPSTAAIKASTGIIHSEFQIIYAIACALSSAVLWRKWASAKITKFLREMKITQDDGTLWPWQNISQDTRYEYSQLGVRLKNGRQLFCEDLSIFNNKPHGPFIMGEDGSIALYVTEVVTGDGTVHPQDPQHRGGIQITFIPSSEISEVDFRISNEK
ncbi:MAG: hypothetical protein ACJAW4_000594 [Paracoccaceae bacterium]|jgi:hypothetical protein